MLEAMLAALSLESLSSTFAPLDGGVQLLQPFCTCYNDTGLFGLYFTMDMSKKEAVDEAITCIQEELVAMTGCRAAPADRRRLKSRRPAFEGMVS